MSSRAKPRDLFLKNKIPRLGFAASLGMTMIWVGLLAGLATAADNVITIKGVYLKNDAGEWVKVIEPDRKVDFSKEEAVVSFFNNGGRVPAGMYKNFRIDFFSEDDPGSVKKLYSEKDLEKSVAVAKGSFIRVAFDLKLEEKITVKKADLVVGEDGRELLADSLTLEV